MGQLHAKSRSRAFSEPKGRFLTPSVVFLLLFHFLSGSAVYAEPKWVKNAVRFLENDTARYGGANTVLWEKVYVRIQRGPKARTVVRRVWKVLRNGLDPFDISWHLTPETKMKRFNGWALFPGGKRKRLKRKNLITINAPDVAGDYTDVRFISLSSKPMIGKGGFFAYEYELEEEGLGALQQAHSWLNEQPIAYSEFGLEIPHGLTIRYLSKGKGVVHEMEEKRHSEVHLWRVTDLPWIDTSTPYLPPLGYLRPSLFLVVYDSTDSESRMFHDWWNLRAWLHDLFGNHCQPNAELTSYVHSLTDTCRNLESKVLTIASFVRDRIRYVSVEIDKGRIEPRDADRTLQLRYGDCKDMATLLVAMLGAVGVDAYPALCNTKLYISREVPSIAAFNHAIVAIPVDSLLPSLSGCAVDGLLFFDPTAKESELESVPEYLRGDYVLVLRETGNPLVKVPRSAKIGRNRRYSLLARFAEEGAAYFKARITDWGVLGLLSRGFVTRNSRMEVRKAWMRRIMKLHPGKKVVVDSVSFETTADSVIWYIDFRIPHYANRLRHGWRFRFHPLLGREKVVQLDCKRAYPIFLGGYLAQEHHVCWTISADRVFKVDLQSDSASCEAASVSFRVIAKDSCLFLRGDYQQRYKIMAASQCKAVRKFLKTKTALSSLSIWVDRTER